MSSVDFSISAFSSSGDLRGFCFIHFSARSLNSPQDSSFSFGMLVSIKALKSPRMFNITSSISSAGIFPSPSLIKMFARVSSKTNCCLSARPVEETCASRGVLSLNVLGRLAKDNTSSYFSFAAIKDFKATCVI